MPDISRLGLSPEMAADRAEIDGGFGGGGAGDAGPAGEGPAGGAVSEAGAGIEAA